MAFDYDAAYRQPGFYWGREPNDLCLQVVEQIPATERRGKRVIDLGCGEGRDLSISPAMASRLWASTARNRAWPRPVRGRSRKGW